MNSRKPIQNKKQKALRHSWTKMYSPSLKCLSKTERNDRLYLSQIMTVIEPYSTQINYLQGYFSLSLNHIGRLLFNNRKGNKC